MNINESVIIKLNETGMSILRDEHSDLKSAFPSLHNFVEIDADEDGLYQKKMQLWSVMQTFGPHISLGTNPPFSTEIDISNSYEVNKLKEINKELLAALEALEDIYCDTSRDHITIKDLKHHKAVRANVQAIIDKAKGAS